MQAVAAPGDPGRRIGGTGGGTCAIDRMHAMTERAELQTDINLDSLGDLLAKARRVPMLDKDEEHELALRWRDEGDRFAARRLVESHLRLAVKIARGFSGYGLPLEDLVSEALVGLTQAVRKFDPDRDVRFSTYALWWIRAAVQEYVLKHWSQVKLGTTASQKKLFFNLNKLKNQLGKKAGEDLLPEDVRQIAQTLDVSEADVMTMHERLGARDMSLQTPVGEEGDMDWQDQLTDTGDSPEVTVGDREEHDKRHDLLTQAMTDVLTDRQRAILRARRLSDEPRTLEELAEVYGISRERVRQIENQAFTKVQRAMLARQASETMAANDKQARPKYSLAA
jgi:RNA polymerase sigma-32 factor